MSGNLNYQKAKRNIRARQAVHDHPADYDQRQVPPRPIRGWRTAWNGEPFPVVVSFMQNGKVADLHKTESAAA